MISIRRTTRSRVAGLTVAGAAALALTLGGCTSGSGSSGTNTSAASTQLSAFEVVQASAKQSQEAGSAKFALTVDTSAQGQQMSLSGEGAFTEDGSFEMTTTLPAEAGGSALQLKLVDGVFYLSGAPLTAEGQWVKMPLEDMAATGFDAGQVDPSAQLAQLRAIAEDVREVDPVTVRGVEARGFAGTIDPQKAYDQLPAEQKSPEAEQALEDSGIADIPFTLYVDDENRPVRMSQQISASHDAATGAEGAVTASVTMDFFDWGTDVDVTAPDPASVVEAPAGLGAGAPADQAA